MNATKDIKNKYDSSIALIVLCCRIHFKSSNLDDLKTFIVANEIDWSVFYKSSSKQKVRPIVYRILLKTELPETVKITLTNELNKLTLHSFEQAKETERIIYLCKENGVNLLPYKGTAFSKQFFGNINMRESSDIDLIIPPDDIPKAIEILEKDGYSPYQKEYYQWVGHEQFIKFHKDFSFDKHDSSKRLHHVELHFNILGKTTYLPDHRNTFVTQQTTNYKLFQKEVDCLLPVEHFRAVALHHMLMDTMGYLKTVVDLAQMFQSIQDIQSNQELNSNEIAVLKTMEEQYNLSLVKSLIKSLLGVDLAMYSSQKSTNSLSKRILSGSYRKVRENKSPFFDTISFTYTHLKYSTCFYVKRIDKFKYLSKSFINIMHPQPEDCMSIILPKYLFFMYYIIRPFRLVFFPGDPTKK